MEKNESKQDGIEYMALCSDENIKLITKMAVQAQAARQLGSKKEIVLKKVFQNIDRAIKKHGSKIHLEWIRAELEVWLQHAWKYPISESKGGRLLALRHTEEQVSNYYSILAAHEKELDLPLLTGPL